MLLAGGRGGRAHQVCSVWLDDLDRQAQAFELRTHARHIADHHPDQLVRVGASRRRAPRTEQVCRRGQKARDLWRLPKPPVCAHPVPRVPPGAEAPPRQAIETGGRKPARGSVGAQRKESAGPDREAPVQAGSYALRRGQVSALRRISPILSHVAAGRT